MLFLYIFLNRMYKGKSKQIFCKYNVLLFTILFAVLIHHIDDLTIVMAKKDKEGRKDKKEPTESQFLEVGDLLNFRFTSKQAKTRPKRKGRGPQKAPKKVPVSIRLDKDVYEYFKSTGRGWQSEINTLLLGHIKKKSKTKR